MEADDWGSFGEQAAQGMPDGQPPGPGGARVRTAQGLYVVGEVDEDGVRVGRADHGAAVMVTDALGSSAGQIERAGLVAGHGQVPGGQDAVGVVATVDRVVLAP
ncbi:hypothetical protein [Streptomyces sp. ISL-100]|uniref:hypothetical protein n=1 Tax=Streptomyces sp. ISL-100 TaxID=2819173 RepID=UPI001BE54B8C|nr:hypothetical protein [Streptomyces sp. ISL-100]MBT2395035.1 hypothetical protein [Streptomyces sp. ISL-100]